MIDRDPHTDPPPVGTPSAASPQPAGPDRTRRRRIGLVLAAAAAATADLAVKAWAETALAGRVLPVGPVDLRLGYNPGVAFSLGASAPAGVGLAVTAAITLALLVLAWRQARHAHTVTWIGLALVLGGTGGHLIDRVIDGAVTDFQRGRCPHRPGHRRGGPRITPGFSPTPQVTQDPGGSKPSTRQARP